MATHSSVLAWRIPGTGAHRVGHDWRDLAGAALFSMTKYIHIVVQLSLCIHLLNFLPSLVETLSPLSINSSFPPTRSLASNNVLTESMNLTILGISYKWSQTVFVCTYCILEGRMQESQWPKNLPASAGDIGLTSGSGRSCAEGNGNPTPVFLLEKVHGQRILVGYSLRGCKESDTMEQLSSVPYQD